jgi:hypothetical protein
VGEEERVLGCRIGGSSLVCGIDDIGLCLTLADVSLSPRFLGICLFGIRTSPVKVGPAVSFKLLFNIDINSLLFPSSSTACSIVIVVLNSIDREHRPSKMLSLSYQLDSLT